jgi:hypothetical protein
MDFLDTLLKYSDQHSKTIMVALAALITVGAVGVGISIRNLQSTLENRTSPY